MGELSFCELKNREVVNVCDGKRLGRIIDMCFNKLGHITGFVVPGDKKIIKCVSGNDSIFIPWKCIVKIGEDTILVELDDGLPPC
ncbi:MAG: YlmC/YmxH family sporulation protein [Christensenellales bacterium]|nr:YlmC/YmxH family sporulation protein [Clostridia bacterium]MDY4083767.1 YlmC/YmxH family sporulation protein [Eubacteriales bacterium]